MLRASDRHAADVGSIPRCGKGSFFQSQLSVQSLLRCPGKATRISRGRSPIGTTQLSKVKKKEYTCLEELHGWSTARENVRCSMCFSLLYFHPPFLFFAQVREPNLKIDEDGKATNLTIYSTIPISCDEGTPDRECVLGVSLLAFGAGKAPETLQITKFK